LDLAKSAFGLVLLASWAANLLPLIFLGYLAFFFHISF